ncbi:sialate:O-sulfotransferase 1-like [Apostichopus japonicus]|uniref:sialate:O-sulfotransferase 1-like n=1 Tax=Stichopus japonicus TaxID=307972 RepID=UPI003AB1603F
MVNTNRISGNLLAGCLSLFSLSLVVPIFFLAEIRKNVDRKGYLRRTNRLLQEGQTHAGEGSQQYYGELVSGGAFGQTFQTWTNFSAAPGTYRGCINLFNYIGTNLTIVFEEISPKMTVERCLTKCNKKGHTYAGLLHGSKCHCVIFTGPVRNLRYLPTTMCDAPCSGNPLYHCGGTLKVFSLYRTRVLDTRCSEMSLRPKNSMPLIALASFPGSGNAWTRRLLERSTGIYTGSVASKTEGQIAVRSEAFLGDQLPYYSRTTLCQMTHLFKVRHVDEFTSGAILLIRNPYTAIVTEVFNKYMNKSDADSQRRAIEFMKSEDWPSFVDKSAFEWLATATNWIRRSKRLIVVNYEDLQEDSTKQLLRMLEFLDQPLDVRRIACAIQEYPSTESTKVFLGAKRSDLNFDPFSNEMHKRIEGHIRTVNVTLAQYGHSTLPRYISNFVL